MRKIGYFMLILCMTLLWSNALAALPVTDGLVMHLEADSITGVANGDPVATWPDLSTAGNDATQATAARQPLFIAHDPEFKGHAVVRFDRTDDFMNLPYDDFNVGSFTVFAAGRYHEVLTNVNQYLIAGYCSGGSANGRMRMAIDYHNDTFFEYRAGNSHYHAVYYTPADAYTHVFAMTSTTEGFLDGVSLGTDTNTSTDAPDGLIIGAFDPCGTMKDYFGGDIAELVIFDRVLSEEEIADVSDYLYSKYAGNNITNPNPDNEETGVGDISEAGLEVTFQWDGPPDPNHPTQLDPSVKKHYLWVSPGGVTDANLILEQTITVTDYSTLTATSDPILRDYDQTYYWQVEEGLDDGQGSVYAAGDPNNYLGPIWSFSTLPSTPYIDPQPQNALFAPSDPNVVLTLGAATGFPPLSYEWYKDDGLIPDPDAGYEGQRSDTLVILNPDINDEGEYYCKVTADNSGISYSDTVVVRMKQLIAQYEFEQNADDSAGTNHGTEVGTIDYTTDVVVTTGGQAYAADPNGGVYAALTTDAYPNAGFGNGLAEGTVSVWVKADTNATQALLGSGNTGSTTFFQIELPYTDAGIIRLYMRDQDGTAIDCRASDTGVLDNEWHHVAIAYQADTGAGSTATIYYDGESAGTATAAALDNLVAWEFPMVLLARNNRGTADENFSDMVDDLQIYNYALTQNQVIDIYHAVSGESVCIDEPTYDLSGDCLITLTDFVMFAAQWMECGLYPECP